MAPLRPRSPEELASSLLECASARKTIRLVGNDSKARAGGMTPEGACISTAGLDQVLIYEPRDLTISVQAGLRWSALTEMLDRDGMMIPLDPPFASEATVGGVICANSSGPRRRLYGTARDLVIGMRFATLEGKLVQSGGMVVKNVAGLDMAKLLIGSMGTLAAVAVINFKLIPKPLGTRSFVFAFTTASEALALRDRVLQGVLQPAAIDLLNPSAAASLDRKSWVLAIGAAGNPAVLDRYKRELPGAEVVEGAAERALWSTIEELPARFLAQYPEGAIVRASVPLASLTQCVEKLPGRVLARAGNGVAYAFLEDASRWRNEGGIMEFGPASGDPKRVMWPETDSGFPIMQRIKQMFDPNLLLNPGRLYGRI